MSLSPQSPAQPFLVCLGASQRTHDYVTRTRAYQDPCAHMLTPPPASWHQTLAALEDALQSTQKGQLRNYTTFHQRLTVGNPRASERTLDHVVVLRLRGNQDTRTRRLQGLGLTRTRAHIHTGGRAYRRRVLDTYLKSVKYVADILVYQYISILIYQYISILVYQCISILVYQCISILVYQLKTQ